ncbi:DUF421 domain-containing protein [Bacillus sp. DJP31]|uniref:DUF421 domain-containing protein n=1 Tax=Bacillus sp. DJP31 TaxID=3409789 RepID=UPI003BB5A637
MDFIGITLKLVIGYIVLMVTTKILGKTQINQLTPFDFISALVLGELVGGAVHDKDLDYLHVIYVVAIWGFLIFITEFITQKFKNTRSLLEGRPAIVIHKGKINYKALKSNKLDLNQLLNLLRKKDVFSVREVEFAILESDGTASVLKKSYFDKPTRADLNLKEKPVYLPIAFVSDGEIIGNNLKEAGFNEEWLRSQLQVHGCNRVSDCLYAEWKEGESLHVIKY